MPQVSGQRVPANSVQCNRLQSTFFLDQKLSLSDIPDLEIFVSHNQDLMFLDFSEIVRNLVFVF